MKDHRFYKKVTHGAKGPVLAGGKKPMGWAFCPIRDLFIKSEESYEWIGMKLCEQIWNDTMKNSRNFGDDLGFLRWVNEQRNTMIVVAWPVHGAGTDPEAFM